MFLFASVLLTLFLPLLVFGVVLLQLIADHYRFRHDYQRTIFHVFFCNQCQHFYISNRTSAPCDICRQQHEPLNF